jgi:hypothetical protein
MNKNTLRDGALRLLRQQDVGTLSTHSVKLAGYPFGSLTPYALDADETPLLLLSGLALHTKNLIANPRASLLVTGSGREQAAAVAARLTIVGEARRIEDEQALRRYVEAHPDSAQWAGFGDFGLWRLEPVSSYFVAGFGEMGWID